MRENKFRAWDKEHNKMWFMGQEGESIGDWTFQTYFNKQGCLEAVIYRCFDNGIGLESQDIKLPIMQDTGMRDKNGTEIYDGDIVEIISKVTMEYVKGKIIFGSGCYLVKYGWNTHLLCEFTDDITVVGNVYDNPEL